MDTFDRLPKDLLIKLAIDLDLPDLLRWCQLNKRFNNLTCRNDTFWMNKFYHEYGKYSKVPYMSWKDFYKYVTTIDPDDLLIGGAKNNNLNYVKIALGRGANINTLDDDALQLASQNGHLSIVKYLAEHGADINALDDWALILASRNGHLSIVKYLVKHGADIHSRDYEALKVASRNGHLSTIKYLVEHGAVVTGLSDWELQHIRDKHPEVYNYLNSLQ